MEILRIKEIVSACGGDLICGEDTHAITGITTNSKEGAPGSLFVAIIGERFDGHDFIHEFLQSGDAVITQRDTAPVEGKSIIRVGETIKALRDIAKYYRDKMGVPVVGITGSVGKTSTKDMIASVLSQRFNTHKTMGNYNNEIGLPLTVFNIKPEHQISVLEMGMNNKGEISRLTDIAQPETAVITNIGTAHIGNLGSVEGILSAKLEMLEKLKPDGVVILNGDDPLLWGLRGKLPYSMIYYGIDNYFSDITATDIILGSDKSKFRASFKDEEYVFTINAVGGHHIYNALAAAAVGLYYNIEVENIINGVAQFTTGAMRQNIYRLNRARIIEDCYNANPDSMKSALDVLQKLAPHGNSVAVFGDMTELGGYSAKAHEQVGKYIAETGVGALVTVGGEMRITGEAALKGGMRDVYSFNTNDEAAEFIRRYLEMDVVMLIKASRVMRFEEIVRRIKEF